MSENFQNYDENFIETETEGAEENFAPLRGFISTLSPEEIAKGEEKKALLKLSNIIGISAFLISVLSVVMAFCLKIGAFLTGNPQGVTEFLNEPAIFQIYQICFSLIVFTVPFIVCFKIGKYKIGEFISFEGQNKGMELSLFFMGAVFCFFANMGSAYIDSIFSAFGIDYSIGRPDVPEGIFGFLLYTLSVAIVPAVLEEFAFRGIVLGSLRKFGDTFALIVSAVCFGIMHGNFDQIPFAFMVGLFLGFTVIKTNSLKIAIFIHFFNNFISVVFSYLSDTAFADYQNLIFMALLSVCLVLALIFIRGTDQKELFKIQSKGSLLTEKEKYKTFFLSLGIIVFIVTNLLQAVSLIFN